MDSNQPLDQDYGAGSGFSDLFFQNLRATGGWALFLAVLGFISIGFLLVTGFSISIFGGMAMEGFADEMPFPFQLLGILYLVMAAIYFFPVLYLYQFAQSARTMGEKRSADELEATMGYLHKHYRFLGIMTIALIALYLVGLAGLFTMGVGLMG